MMGQFERKTLTDLNKDLGGAAADGESIQPNGNRVLIKPTEARDKTVGGIFIPEEAKASPKEGVVIAVGPGRLTRRGDRIIPPVKVGDRILHDKYGGVEVITTRGKMRVLDADEIQAIFEEDL